MLLDTHLVGCPYCGESIELTVDTQEANQEYIEDCHVCCQPIVIKLLQNTFDQSVYLDCRRDQD
jgi:hypothetical protein